MALIESNWPWLSWTVYIPSDSWGTLDTNMATKCFYEFTKALIYPIEVNKVNITEGSRKLFWLEIVRFRWCCHPKHLFTVSFSPESLGQFRLNYIPVVDVVIVYFFSHFHLLQIHLAILTKLGTTHCWVRNIEFYFNVKQHRFQREYNLELFKFCW